MIQRRSSWILSYFLVLFFLLVCYLSEGNAQWVQVSHEPGYTLGVAPTSTLINFGAVIPLRSADFGRNWSEVNTMPSYPTYAGSFTTLGTYLFAGDRDNGVYRSIDDGISWLTVNSGLPQDALDTNNHSIWIQSMATVGTNIFATTYMSPEGHLVFISVSSDSGATWNKVNIVTGINGHPTFGFVSLVASGSNLFACNGNPVFLSSDLGTNWIEVDSGLATAVSTLFVSGDTLFAGTENVFRSTNNGATWTESDSGLNSLKIHSHFVNDFAMSIGVMFAATGGGLFFSKNGGSIWQRDYELTDTNIYSLAVDGPYLFAGTDRGVWRRPLSDYNQSGVGSTAVPANSISLTAYPDPITSTTTISFTLPAASQVTLTLTDAAGRETPLLPAQYISAGQHEVTWDASNYPSGVYLCRIEAGGESATRRVVVMH